MPQSVLERPSTKEAGKKASPFCRWALSNPLTRCTQPKKEWNTENRIEFLLHNRTVLLLWPAWRSLPIPLPIAGIRTLAWNPWLGAASSVLMMTHISYLDQPPPHLHPHWHLSWSSGQAVLAKDTLCAQWALVKINWSTCLGAAALLFTFTSTFAFTFTAAYLTHIHTHKHIHTWEHNSNSWACWQSLSRSLWSHIQYPCTGSALYDLFWHLYPPHRRLLFGSPSAGVGYRCPWEVPSECTPAWHTVVL